MSKSKIAASAFVSILIAGLAVTANGQTMEPQKVDTITNQELEKVAKITKEIRVIQRNANQELREIVGDTKMDFRRYRAIMISRQNPKADSVDVTKEEKQILKKILPQVAEMNRQNKQKLNEAIKEQGLTKQRLQQILLVLRTDKEAAQRFQKIVVEQNRKQQQ